MAWVRYSAGGALRMKADIPATLLQDKLWKIVNDEKTGREIHGVLKECLEPYVPKKSGQLRSSAKVYPKSLRYTAPYAHYQYQGEVYGPNLIGWLSPSEAGWRSYKGMKKSPTGRELGVQGAGTFKPMFGQKYNKSPITWEFGYTTSGTHHHWLDEMMKHNRRGFHIRCTNVMKRRAKELNK